MPSRKSTCAGVAAAVAVAAGLFTGGSAGRAPVAIHVSPSLTPMQLRLLSGTSEHALINLGVLTASAEHPDHAAPGRDSEGEGTAAGAAGGGAGGTSGGSLAAVNPGKNGLCAQSVGSNVRVNTACTNYADKDLHGRSMAQNETSIAVSPTDKRNLIGSSNDYSRGDGNCGSYFSTDGGDSWGGTTAPMLFVRGRSLTPPTTNARHYWQAGGDTQVAFNSHGTAFLQCQVFNRGTGTTQDPDTSSGIMFFRSANKGASWDFPGRVAASSYEPDRTSPNGVVLEDKPFFAIDSRVGSRYQDRIYMTWTSFTADGNAYINETQSTDGGENWSPRRVIGGNSAALCPVTFGLPTPNGTCNQNQFSDPFVGQDGSLYVVYSNFNNASANANDNHNQALLVKSTDGGATFSAPIKVTDYYDLPDCATYTGHSAGRSCVVNKGAAKTSYFRASQYPSGAVDPTNAGHVVVTIGSYINRVSNEATGCTPTGFSAVTGINTFTGTGTQACNNQIIESQSSDGAATFTGTTTDPRAMQLAATQSTVADEFFQWMGFTSKGEAVVGFYDRQYGTDNTDGSSDYSVAATGTTQRVTTVASPPPTEFGGSFYGDYNQIAVQGKTAYVSWTDDRNPGVTSCAGNVNSICTLGHDEDMFMAAIKI